ncbi:hypothetical protein B9Z55_022091 [Caenorhabditis nigoni]|uniref:Uncharacterized protein n=1 Tax=Caenorhabditis nigoni TaxID=1611254 RepID=A0A2G5TVB4_9PELO|nr:hypothetical protein B9Z55_022091 [Caenorhabditis nigoni]
MGSTPPPAEKILPNPPVETTPGQISQAYRQDLEDVISKGNRENFLDPASALTEGKLPEGSWPLILSFEFLAKHADFFKEQDEILKTHEDDAVKVSEALDEIRKDVAENVLHGSEAVEKVKQDVEDVKGDVEEIKKTLSKVDEKKELLLNHATTHENAMKLAESRANALDSLVKQLQKRIEVLEQNQGSSKEERSNRVEWDETQLKIKEESKNIERGARKRCSLCDTDSHMLASCPVFPTRQDVAKEIKRRR